LDALDWRFFVGTRAARWVFSELGQLAALSVVCQKELKNTVIAAKSGFLLVLLHFCWQLARLRFLGVVDGKVLRVLAETKPL
jgi:hypothetical protein